MNSTKKKPPGRNWRPFKEARSFAHNLKYKNKTQWAIWAKSHVRPDDIPATPNEVYINKGWNGWGDWLGTRNRRGGFRAFQEARIFVHNLRLGNVDGWTKWAKSDSRPDDIPVDPSKVYKNKGWAGWRDWLGEKSPRKIIEFRPFLEARKFARALGFKNGNEWKQWSKTSNRPKDIPSN